MIAAGGADGGGSVVCGEEETVASERATGRHWLIAEELFKTSHVAAQTKVGAGCMMSGFVNKLPSLLMLRRDKTP
jgi:hypothetical protein